MLALHDGEIPGPQQRDRRRDLRDIQDANVLTSGGIGWGIYGPDVWARRGDQTSGDGECIEWANLARVLGQSVPFWLDRLLHPDLITIWKPDDPPVRYHGVPGVDIDSALLRMAVLYPVDHPVHKTMIHYSQVISVEIQCHRQPGLEPWPASLLDVVRCWLAVLLEPLKESYRVLIIRCSCRSQ